MKLLDGGTMTDRQRELHLAKVYLAQARVFRARGKVGRSFAVWLQEAAAAARLRAIDYGNSGQLSLF